MSDTDELKFHCTSCPVAEDYRRTPAREPYSTSIKKKKSPF